MLAILSPAKTFARKPSGATPPSATEPTFVDASRPIVEAVLRMSDEELRRALALSPKLTGQARHDWQAWISGDAPRGRALEMYSGMVFKRINARGLSAEAWSYAEGHLLICSFVYGLLRPADIIAPYRMEGTMVLESGATVFAYWRPLLTRRLIDATLERGGVLVYLASEEMKQLFDWAEVERAVRVITPTFLTRQPDGSAKQIVIYTKMARGEMARAILEGQLQEPEALQRLTPADFVYDSRQSTTDEWVYVLG